MRDRTRLPLLIVAGLVLGLALIVLSACDLPTLEPMEAVGTPTDTPPPPEEGGAGEPTAEPGEATPQPPAFITLTMWTTEALSPTQVMTSGQILAGSASAFLADNPEVRLRFVLKKPHGEGGILDILQTTGAVVPSHLPELVFIDVHEVGPAVKAGLVQPLDDLLPAALVDDLYPFARESCTHEGQLYCLQFQADLDHLVYNVERLPLPPGSWPDVMSSGAVYSFPAAGQGGLVNDDTLAQYLAVRSWPADDQADDPFFDEDSLVAVLQYYLDGRVREVFPAEILNYHSTDDSWRDYLAGESDLAHVSAHRYLVERMRAQTSAPAAVPTINGPVSALGRGWALALVTADPFRQPAAVEFMERLMSPETNAALNEAENYLPTSQTAITYWNTEDEYTSFVHQQLLMARPRPQLPNYVQLAAALQVAVESVLDGSATPQEAAAAAIEAVQ